jgi:HAD superfamily hydrolase (TIGR01549 family)
VVFDMDGTLTISSLDFEAMKAQCGAPPDQGLLEFLESAPEPARRLGWAVLTEHERRAAAQCELREGAREVTQELLRRGLRLALLTRNSSRSVRTVLERFELEFDCCLSREDGVPKPAPDALHEIARRLGLQARQMLVVGDYLYDMLAGRAAGTATAFIRTEKGHEPPFEADVVVDNLRELLDLLPG